MCVCGKDIPQGVQCKDQEIFIEIGLCYCMYYDEGENETILDILASIDTLLIPFDDTQLKMQVCSLMMYAVSITK